MSRVARKTKREDIIEILQTRFVTAPGGIVESIQRIDDPNLLKELHRKAITAASLEEFQGNLP